MNVNYDLLIENVNKNKNWDMIIFLHDFPLKRWSSSEYSSLSEVESNSAQMECR